MLLSWRKLWSCTIIIISNVSLRFVFEALRYLPISCIGSLTGRVSDWLWLAPVPQGYPRPQPPLFMIFDPDPHRKHDQKRQFLKWAMRLINVRTLAIEQFFGSDIPPTPFCLTHGALRKWHFPCLLKKRICQDSGRLRAGKKEQPWLYLGRYELHW